MQTLAQVFAKIEEPQSLTVEMLEEAIREIPTHRTDLHKQAQSALSLVKRGIPIKTNAPAWVQIQNAVSVSKIDSDGRENDDE